MRTIQLMGMFQLTEEVFGLFWHGLKSGYMQGTRPWPLGSTDTLLKVIQVLETGSCSYPIVFSHIICFPLTLVQNFSADCSLHITAFIKNELRTEFESFSVSDTLHCVKDKDRPKLLIHANVYNFLLLPNFPHKIHVSQQKISVLIDKISLCALFLIPFSM